MILYMFKELSVQQFAPKFGGFDRKLAKIFSVAVPRRKLILSRIYEKKNLPRIAVPLALAIKEKLHRTLQKTETNTGKTFSPVLPAPPPGEPSHKATMT